MASILSLPRQHTVNPHYSLELDREWTNKIPFACITGIPGSIDVVSKELATINGTVGYRPGQRGTASYTGAVSDGLVWANKQPVPSIFNTGISLLILANPSSTSTVQRPFFLGDEQPIPSNQYNQVGLAFNSTKAGVASAGQWAAFEYDFGFRGQGDSVAGVVDGQYHVFIATRPSGYGAFTLYTDGIDVTSSTGFANGVDLNDGCRIHCHPSGSQGYMGDVVLAVVFNYQLTAVEAQTLSNNPWQIFRPARRYLFIGDAGAGNTYTISPSGGLVFSGSSALLKTKIFLPTGNLTLAGTSALVKTKVLNPAGGISLSGDAPVVKTKIVTPTGGLSLAGTSLLLKTKILDAGGTITLSGTASLSGAMTYIITPVGNVTLSGTAALVKTRVQIPTGRITFSGSAPMESNTVVSVTSSRIPLTGAGS